VVGKECRRVTCPAGPTRLTVGRSAETHFPLLTMSARQRSVSPSAPSPHPNRSSHRRDRADRDWRREKDGEYRGRDRRDRDEYRSSGPSRQGRDYDSKRSSRRSASPPSRSSRKPRSKSPPSRRKRSRSRSRSKSRRADGDEDGDKDKDEDKGKPNFGSSGLLAAATKTVKTDEGKGVVLKYHEPPEARKPLLGWRLYVFKGSEQVDLLHIHRQSAYLVGRDKAVVDIPLDHPSCSKQHAVIQHRSIREKDELGNVKTKIKPFIIDLESTNGTHVNDGAVPTSRYYELRASDVIKFGDSPREYVLLHDEAS